MNKQWMDILKSIPEGAGQLICPNCKKISIEYLYTVDAKTRIGYLQVWCDSCGVGAHLSRTIAPEGAKTITFEQASSGSYPLPKYKAIL